MAKKKQINPSRRKRLERRFNDALRHHQAGQLNDAERGYRQLIEADPEHGHGLHYLGLILRQRGQESEAIDLLTRASHTAHADASLMNNLGSLLCDNQRREDSIEVFARGVELEPENHIVRLNLAGMLMEFHDFAEAHKHYQALTNMAPDNLQARMGLGRVLLAMGAIDEAINELRKVVDNAPQDADAHIHLTRALLAGDQLNEAFDIANQALALAPNSAKALASLGSVQMTLERYELAVETFRKLLQQVPNDSYTYGELIHALVDAKREEEALEVCAEAFERIPGFATGYANMGNALKQLGRLEEAIDAYKMAIKLDPHHEPAFNNMGTAYIDLGDMESAQSCFEQVLKLSPDMPEPIFNLIRMKKCSREDSELIQKLESLIAQGTLLISERVSAHNALGKAYDDLQDYKNAFEHYHQSNVLKRQTVMFSPDKFMDWVQNFQSTFTPEFFQRCQGFGLNSERPIFIVGMPRSGTTLVEQIISSHPRVYGADELTYLSEYTDDFPNRFAGEEYPLAAAHLSAPIVQELAKDYLSKLSELNQDADFVTDKMPSNYYHLGLISIMFPRCHIIHCQRNPMDTCFSNFIQLFGTGHFYSYSLDDIAVCYRAYEDLMAHWRRVLPISIFDVSYEALVEDQEQISRDIIAALGLEWDDGCLSFYENRRTVRTASHWQVRQPIYKSARQRWKNYAPYLEKLRHDIGFSELN